MSHEAAIATEVFTQQAQEQLQYAHTVLSAYPAYHVYRWQNTATTYKEVRVYGARSVHSFQVTAQQL